MSEWRLPGLSACVLLFRAIVNLFCQFGKLVGMKAKMEGRAAVVQFERMCPALPGVDRHASSATGGACLST